MTLLTAPPPPAPPPDLPAVSFFGRTLDEYVRFFALDVAVWRGRAVLDVAAGPSSFTAEAGRRGIDAVAVDPLYALPPARLAEQVRDDYERVAATMRAQPRRFRCGPGGAANARHFPAARTAAARPRPYFPSLAAAEADRRLAASRFLADFEGNLRHGRYVRGALPRLPFLDGSFDLVLCAHLLFLHAARFDLAWHVTACAELARVSAGEVRIHPVSGPDGRTYPELEALRADLAARNIRSALQRVDYEFCVGSGTMLVLNPRSA